MSEDRKIRVVATRSGAARHSKTDADYVVKVVVEWVVIYESAIYRAGMHEVSVTGPRNAEDFVENVLEDFVGHIQALFPSENFRAKDVMLIGF